ncbi:hypothetical protein ACQUJT_10740 [Ralstonia pseudosolanacearum]
MRTRTGTGRGCMGSSSVALPCSQAANRKASLRAVSMALAAKRVAMPPRQRRTPGAAVPACDGNVDGFLLGRCMAVSCGMPSVDGRTDANRNLGARKN